MSRWLRPLVSVALRRLVLLALIWLAVVCGAAWWRGEPMTELTLRRITHAIDAYRAGEISAEGALVAIGIYVDAERFQPPTVPEMTDADRKELDALLAEMMQMSQYRIINTTSAGPLRNEDNPL